jgi:hypothetical protein
LHKVGVEIVAVRRAWRRCKGRHPAGLNYGDCFSYALAALSGEPLLYKGNDSSQTYIMRHTMENPSSPPENVPDTSDAGGDTDRNSRHPIPIPLPLLALLEGLADRARTYVEAARSANTRRAYAADWKHFAASCRQADVERDLRTTMASGAKSSITLRAALRTNATRKAKCSRTASSTGP